MSSLEREVSFRKRSEIKTPVEAQFNGSSEFILISDHLTTKRRSLAQLESSEEIHENVCQSCAKNVFRKKTLYKRFPVLQWLPRYNRQDLIGDLIAGFTVGLTVIPQGLAYSSVAGLPTEYGLYGSFMGCFVYMLLGTCKDSTVGSTAIASLLVFQVAQGVWQRAILLTFLTGIIELCMAALKLGFLVEFVSGPVSAGFTSAITMIVFTSQMRNIFGINSEGVTFLQRWINLFSNIKDMQVPDTILGVVCVIILLLLRYIGQIKITTTDRELALFHKVINKVVWFLSVTRNASVVIAFGIWSYFLHQQGNNKFTLTGYVPSGLPEFRLPPFSIDPVPGNATAGVVEVQGETFLEMVDNLGWGLIIVPLIALLENISVCKAFGKGKTIDATQELIAMGIANVANSLCQGYRANGGLARSAVNNASGVRTPMANLQIGLIVVFALMYLTEFFYYIPKAVLASIIVAAVIFQLQYQVVLPMWRSKRWDLIPGFVAFIACLVLPLEIGVLVAIGVDLLFILYYSARPEVSLEILETYEGQKFLKLTPDRCLIFPSVEFVRNLVMKSGNKTSFPVVLDCTYIYGADYTAAKVISSLIEDFRLRNQKIIFFNLKPSVAQIFEGVNPHLVICYNIAALTQELRLSSDYQIFDDHPIEVLAENIENNSNASTITLTKL